jgi:4-amino-4-deoxy-L-arabinose transferase-like glycosyltransferase
MNFSSSVYLLLFSLTLKIIVAFFLPVFGDESYYWFWGQHVQLSYFDHPGMVGWLTAAGSKLPFLPLGLLVRWPFIFISTLSFWIFLKILNKNTESKNLILCLALFYLLNPMLGIGGIFATPDVGLVFFWTLSYWFTLQIIQKQNSKNYIFLGIALGLGLCSKYHIVLFPISIILSLWFAKKLYLIQFKKLMLTALFGFVFSLPVLVWNFKNDWASFAFQINHGFNGRGYNPMWTVTYVLGQIFLFNPFLFYNFIRNEKKVFTHKSALVQWLFFLISSLKASVEANWPVTAHIQALSSHQVLNKKYFKLAFAYGILIWIVGLAFLWTPLGEKKLKGLPNSVLAEKIWSEVSNYSPLYGPTYQMSSLLHLVSGKEILKLNELSRTDFYDSNAFPKPTEKVFYSLKYDISTWPEWITNARIDVIKKFPEYNLGLYRIIRE